MHDVVEKHATQDAREVSCDASHRFALSRSPTACMRAWSRRTCKNCPETLLLQSVAQRHASMMTTAS